MDLKYIGYTFTVEPKEPATEILIAQLGFAGFESFFEQNRTGYPKISPVGVTSPSYVPGQFTYSVEGKTGGLFPKRLAFPQDERQRNPNAPAASAVTDKVWYDVN